MPKFGTLYFTPALDSSSLLAVPVKNAITTKDVFVSEIDSTLSDTAAFCEKYQVNPEASANCVIIQAKRGEEVWYAACMILATSRIDVNGVVRKYLKAKKTSFAPMDTAVTLSSMEYGGITPIGLPDDWQILVDSQVAASSQVIIGAGVRRAKLLVSGEQLAKLPNATVLDIVKN